MKLKLNKNYVLAAVLLVMLLLVGSYFVFNANEQENQQATAEIDQQEQLETEEPQTQDLEEKTEQEKAIENTQPATAPLQETVQSQWPVVLSINEASSLTVVVNKKYKLPESYAPGLRQETSNAINELLDSASNSGVSLKTISSYRSYATQAATYSRWVARDGQALADTYSARPGHSEHQTGLAVDVGANSGVCDLETCFGNTFEGKWVAENAQDFGFIIRYPNGKDSITGYQYEPWHLRYVGVDIAKAVTVSGLTLDQYYGKEGGGYN